VTYVCVNADVECQQQHPQWKVRCQVSDVAGVRVLAIECVCGQKYELSLLVLVQNDIQSVALGKNMLPLACFRGDR
jgi:hypothetical protein